MTDVQGQQQPQAYPQGYPQPIYVQATATAVVQGPGRWAWRHGAMYHLVMSVCTLGVWVVVAPVLWLIRGLVKG